MLRVYRVRLTSRGRPRLVRDSETHVSFDVDRKGVFCLQRSCTMPYRLPALLNSRGRPRLMVDLGEFSLKSRHFTQQKHGFVVVLDAQAVFAKQAYRQAIDSRGFYQCGGNLFWINMARMVSSQGVPMSARGIEQLKVSHFQSPRPLEHMIIVPVEQEWSYKELKNKFGNLTRLSPEEIEIALIGRIADLVRSGADDIELTLLGYYTILFPFFKLFGPS